MFLCYLWEGYIPTFFGELSIQIFFFNVLSWYWGEKENRVSCTQSIMKFGLSAYNANLI